MTLTREQRQQLERLWFYYGNYGAETTPGNHPFIQSLLEHGLDVRPLFMKRSRKSDQPTPECEAAVNKVLGIRSDTAGDPKAPEVRTTHQGSRIIISPPQQHSETNIGETELKKLIEELRERQRESICYSDGGRSSRCSLEGLSHIRHYAVHGVMADVA